MRILGWLAMALGVIGIVASIALAAGVWVVKPDIQARAHELVAAADGGLERAAELTESVTTELADASARVGDVKAKADELVAATVVDPVVASEPVDDHHRVHQRTVRHAAQRVRSAAGAGQHRRGGAPRARPRHPGRLAPGHGHGTAAGDRREAGRDRCGDRHPVRGRHPGPVRPGGRGPDLRARHERAGGTFSRRRGGHGRRGQAGRST